MGIPRFYRWLSERYPLINENINADQIPEFDNLYLDMNGIIHNCSHNNTGGLCVKEECDVFLEAFKYITRLFYIIRPKKLLYMAVDGCAPRAKMNQQRSRRFRAANDAREARELAEKNGEVMEGPFFDSNCITPGTDFMSKLTEHLRFFICMKIQEDPLWQDVTIVLSGPDEPGEGEHKIMDYIRASKAQPGYQPNLRHCLYGLDADLIMLALASHEPHFALLREEVIFGKQKTQDLDKRLLTSKDRFQLLHISLLREYLELEFNVNGNADGTPAMTSFEFTVERALDDFILFCVLVGNDFLPPLPFSEIGEGGLEHFFTVYKDHLRGNEIGMTPWLTHGCGEVDFTQLARFLHRYGKVEDAILDGCVDEGGWMLGRRRTVGPDHVPDPEGRYDGPIEPVTNAEEARAQWYEVKFGMDIDTHEGTQKRRRLLQSYLEGLQWVMYYYYRGPNAASWSWFYPFYHAPFAQDLQEYDMVTCPHIDFEVGAPFLPFQQLMAVLPSNSKTLLPECFQKLFDAEGSPILDFYPQKFDIDTDGVKVPWGGVTLIPFIQEDRLMSAMAQGVAGGPPLTDAELRRNRFGKAHSYRFDASQHLDAVSPMPSRYSDLLLVPVQESVFEHPPLPPGVRHFKNAVLPGFRPDSWGFPTLHVHPLTFSFESGIKVFQFESKSKSLVITLQPSVPLVPTTQAMQALLRTTYVRIDYPLAHWGKVVAVHTASKIMFAGGRAEDKNPRDHEALVKQLLEDQRRRGLGLKFPADGSRPRRTAGGQQADNWEFVIPVLEVKPAESSYLDAEGERQHQFSTQSSFYLLHLVREDKEPERQRRADSSSASNPLSQLFPLGASVLCINPSEECFGGLGRITKNVGDISACFTTGDVEGPWQTEVMRLVAEQTRLERWHSMHDLATQTGIDVLLVGKVLGSLMARVDGVREDLGMNLLCEDKESWAPLCLPCYSMHKDGRWLFSDLAVHALRDYRDKFPMLFKAFAERPKSRPGQWEKDFEIRFAFPDVADLGYVSGKLLKYINGAPWKKLKLAPGRYAAMEPKTISKLDEITQRFLARCVPQDMMVEGQHCLFRPLDSGVRPPSELMATSGQVKLGQRGCYVKPLGIVPFGTRGTVIGIYGSDSAVQLELLLDQDSFSGTDRQGRTPSMRGVQVPLDTFMPLTRYPVTHKGSRTAPSIVPLSSSTGQAATYYSSSRAAAAAASSYDPGQPEPQAVPLPMAMPVPVFFGGERASLTHGGAVSSSCPADLETARPAKKVNKINKIQTRFEEEAPAVAQPAVLELDRKAQEAAAAAAAAVHLGTAATTGTRRQEPPGSWAPPSAAWGLKSDVDVTDTRRQKPGSSAEPAAELRPAAGVDAGAGAKGMGKARGAERGPAPARPAAAGAAPGGPASKLAAGHAGETYYQVDVSGVNWEEAFKQLLARAGDAVAVADK